LSRLNHTPNFCHFNNQQSTINNQQSTINNHHSAIITRQSSLGNHHSAIINPMEKMQSGGLRTQAEKCRPPGI
jgi:hypothetical protein